jgi:hypothetical protein
MKIASICYICEVLNCDNNDFLVTIASTLLMKVFVKMASEFTDYLQMAQ